MMKREYFNTEQDGFYGAYYPNSQTCHRAVILMLGDKIDDLMIQNVAHKTHIEVTRMGTRAGAATSVEMTVRFPNTPSAPTDWRNVCDVIVAKAHVPYLAR